MPAHPPDIASPYAHSRLYDLACAAPLIVAYGFACAGHVMLVARQWPAAHGWNAWASIADEAATLLFFGLQIALCLMRWLPLAKSTGVLPRATALLGANFNLALLLLPRATLGASWTTLSLALTVAGTLGATIVLAYLGRAFSIFPEARRLVLRGPYRVVRHPLYLAEIVSTLGVTIQFRQPWAALIGVTAIAFQLRRIGFEEAVLRQAFPEYVDYTKRTARILPGLY